MLVSLGEDLTALRQDYFNNLVERFVYYWGLLAPDLPRVEIGYKKGWEGESLACALEKSLTKDILVGFSKVGPHRDDFSFTVDGKSAFSIMSQGQQKVMSYALILAQGSVLSDCSHKRCVYLIDDLSAELDMSRCDKIIDELLRFDAQIFVTIINPEPFTKYKNTKLKLFDLKSI